MTKLTVPIMSDDLRDDDKLVEEEDEETLEGDLDMGTTPDGEPIAGIPNDPLETDGFHTDDEEETF